ncbi:hypothetical protein Q9251_08000 [Alkalihalobacillus macyae]|uniref:hypothetical protein n=1 Tax=Guptibacillus hwajinpoensis TaxID=208199 RepID=UPI00273C4E24|nr:hypothetical protein [Alkalihalobacillus macyae]MDP4550825.1 hypothetical protein [Alkalihalobacillus macyae]
MLKLRALFYRLQESKTVIRTVYINGTQLGDGDPDLVGVTVGQVGADFVLFNQVGSSAGIGSVVVPLDQITAMDY